MLTATLVLDADTNSFEVSVAGLPTGTRAVAVYRLVPGYVAQLLGAVAAGVGDTTATVRVPTGTDGLYQMEARAFDSFAVKNQPEPELLETATLADYQLTRAHEQQLSQVYADHAGTPRFPSPPLAQYLRLFARLTEARAVFEEGDLYHAHTYLQTL